MSALLLCAFAAGFLGSGRVLDLLFAGVGSLQLFPGVVRLAGGAVGGTAAAALVVLALSALFGRFYCSSLCPLGTAQDAASFLGRRVLRRKTFSVSPGRPWLRAAFLAAAAAAFVLGSSPLAGFLDPYSLSGRFLQFALRPLLRLAGNGAAPIARSAGLYWADDLGSFSAPAAAAAAVCFLAVLGAAMRRGRLFCNAVCPVGSVLGVLNALAPFRVRLEADACVSCGACERVCKAECADSAGRALDYSRCVSCLSCLAVCPAGALRWGRPRRARTTAAPAGASRREFLKAAGSGGALLVLSFAAGPTARAYGSRSLPAAPPGAGSLVRFLSSCTACGLCASKCPSGVLRPALGAYGARGFLVPRLDYEASYCQYECTLCSDLCPTGALRKMSLEEKKLAQMGTAALVREKCIVFTKKTACGACAEHCPTGSVRMVPSPTGIPEPVFDPAICVGCGACHHVCPALPEKSITVTGKREQGTALPPTKDLFRPPETGSAPKPPEEDFPF